MCSHPDAGITLVTVTVDESVPVTEAETGLLRIHLPEDNIFGLTGADRNGLSVANGFPVLLHLLARGTHTIEIHTEGTVNSTVTTAIIVQWTLRTPAMSRPDDAGARRCPCLRERLTVASCFAQRKQISAPHRSSHLLVVVQSGRLAGVGLDARSLTTSGATGAAPQPPASESVGIRQGAHFQRAKGVSVDRRGHFGALPGVPADRL